MSYIDDFYGTSTDDKRLLQETCQRPGCTHARYNHGSTRIVRAAWKYIEYEAGKCVRCRCTAFQGDSPILPDEIIDIVERLAGDVHLSDYGIGAMCEQRITRWLGESHTIEVPCGLRPNHDGAHEAKG